MIVPLFAQVNVAAANVTNNITEDVYRADMFMSNSSKELIDWLCNDDAFVYSQESDSFATDLVYITNIFSWKSKYKEAAKEILVSFMEKKGINIEDIRNEERSTFYYDLISGINDMAQMSGKYDSLRIEMTSEKLESLFYKSTVGNYEVFHNEFINMFPKDKRDSAKKMIDDYINSSEYSKKIQNTVDFSGFITEVISIAKNSVDTYIELKTYNRCDEQLIDFCYYLSQNSQSEYIKEVAEELYEDLSKTYEELRNKIIVNIAKQLATSTATATVENAISKIASSLGWSSLLSAAKIGVDAGNFVSDQWFSTKETNDIRISMRACADLTVDLKKSVSSQMSSYKTKYTSKSSRDDAAKKLIYYTNLLYQTRIWGETLVSELKETSYHSDIITTIHTLGIYDFNKDIDIINQWVAALNKKFDNVENRLFRRIDPSEYATVSFETGSVAPSTTTSKYSTGTYKPSEWDGLNMRSGASTSYSKVGAIASGTNFVVTKISGNWGYTTCNGKSGWVCLDYATYVSSSTTTSSSNQIYSNIKLTDSNVDDYVGKKIVDIHNASVTTKITKNGKVSTVTHNPYVYDSYCDGGSKQCVDYAWGRIQDKLKFRPNWTSGHAKDIPSCAPDNRKITSASNTEYTVKVYTKDSGANIKADSLVCFGAVSGNAYGHVIYIEHVKEVNGTTYVYYTHGGVEYYNSGVTGTLYKKSLSDLMKTWGSYTGTVAFISDNNSTSDESEQDTNTKTPETNTPEYETITEGTYVLNCIIQSYRYLTAKTDSNGGQVEAKPFENIDAQKFDIVKSGNGYKIVSKNSSTGRAVSGYNDGSGQTIGNVTLANSSSSSSQIWLFRKEGDYYVIYPSFNTSLALTSASTGRVVVSTYTGNDDQLWKLSLQNEEPEKYTVTYNANGGSGASKEQTKTAGESLTLSSTEPTRNGYKFLGWATSKTGNVKFESGDKYTDDKNITLYAVWEEIKTYTIKYNANGGTGAPSSQTKTHGESIKVSAQKPTRSGYEFDGWATSANGNVEYNPSENYTKDSDITLYAVWKPLTYKVTYNANGGTDAPAAQAKIHNEKLYITDDTPERDGYSFIGWATTKTGSVSYKAGQQYTSDKDITLYAVWKANTYTISYNANGGSGAPKNQTKEYAEGIKLSTQEPTRKDYIFLGWSTLVQGSVEFAPGSVCSVNENITLYALWQEEENEVYYIIYNANGGKNAPSMQTKNEDEDLTISEVVPTREGYTFDGWAIGNDDTVVYSSGDTYKENKTLYLHAVWTANIYTISYNANGGVGAPRIQTKIHDEDIVLSTVEPEKENCTFIGWSDDPYAEYAKYYAEDTFSKNSDTVLYAVWEEIIEEDEEDEETNDDKNQSQKEIPFEDVPEDAWYRKDVENAYKNGLINGKSEKRYAPNDNMTYAEAIKLACTIYQLYYDGEVTLTNGSDVWYSTYMDYALENRIVRTDYSSVANEYVTRKEFVNIFYGALPLKEFAKINNVEDNIIPDVKIGDAYSGEIYTFYRAGILTGNDAKGTFKPDSNISRSEVAAIVTRMLDSGARKETNF